MDRRSERAVRLGAEIESLRARRDRLQAELEAVQRLVALREAEFQHLVRSELFRLDQDEATPPSPPATVAQPADASARSVTEQIRAHFLRNNGVSFSPSDVMHCLNLLPTQDAAVRQALKRLSTSQFLVKQGQGRYQLNEQHPEGRAGLQHDW